MTKKSWHSLDCCCDLVVDSDNRRDGVQTSVFLICLPDVLVQA